MVCFRNTGEIDIESIRTMGASVKEDSAIGFFGTGLKYAIAIILRHGMKIAVYSGDKTFLFDTKPVTIRGKEFNVIRINGDPMGFTTELGKTWDLWMAYRELYCNALDECGDVGLHSHLPFWETGETVVVVEGEKFEAEHHNRGEHFLIGRAPSQVINDVEIFDGEGAHIFYKGIRIYKLPRPSKFTYNITSRVDLNEDRTAKNSYTCAYKVSTAISQSTDRHFLREVVLAGESNLEFNLDLNNYSYSEEFAEIALQEYRRDSKSVNASIRAFVHKLSPAQVYDGMYVELTRVQSVMLERAREFAKQIGFNVSAYPVRIVESLGPSVMALALREQNEIIVSKSSFEKGTKFLAATLIEEVIHLREGLDDETRALQTYLFDKIISLGEELVGAPI